MLLLSATGCKGKSVQDVCKDACSTQAKCSGGGSQKECVDECVEDLEEVSKECLDAFSDLSKCQKKVSCENLEEGLKCLGEAIAIFTDCPELFGDAFGDCCGATDTCDWGSDGICDCGGEASWETDCG